MHVPLAFRLDIARSGNVAVSLSPDYEFVRSEVQRSALLGDLVAMRLHAYELRDEENSLEAAFEWFLRAAASGDVDSMAELGRSFFHGDGVEEDLSAARRYLSAAVKLGHPDAHGWLGDLEAEGHGEVPGHAREIYERGADLGDPRSQYRLGVLLIETSDLRKDQLRGVRLVKQASDWGLHMAMLLRAEQLLEGGLITKDEGEAKSVLEAAAADGCAKAWTILGEIWDFLGDDLDADEARYAYERGVEAGCPWAHWRLADFLMKIDVVGEHKSLRYALYLIAAENGVDQARRNLWALHKKGIGTPDERKRFENLPPESE
jgi:TPR repeat protein